MEILRRMFAKKHQEHHKPITATVNLNSKMDSPLHELLRWYAKGTNLYRDYRLNEAIHCFDEAIKLDPQDLLINKFGLMLGLDAWGHKGIILYEMGRFEEAISCHNRRIDIEPQDFTAWDNKGKCLHSLGRFEEAIYCYDKALEIYPEFLHALYNKGNTLAALNRFSEAMSFYEKAINYPEQCSPNVWVSRGNCLVALSRYEEAICSYDKAIEKYSKHVTLRPGELFSPWYNKALAEDELGLTQNASRSYKKAIELASDQYLRPIEHARKRLLELGVPHQR